MPMFLFTAVAGYITYGSKVGANVLSSYPPTTFISIARVGLAFVVMFSFPLQAFAMRKSVVSLFAGATKSPEASSERDTEADFGQAVTVVAGGKEPAAVTPAAAQPPPSLPPAEGMFELSPRYAIPVLCLVAWALTIAAAGVELGTVIDITGAVAATTISLIGPAVVYMGIFSSHRGACCVAGLVLALGLAVMVWATYMEVLKALPSEDPDALPEGVQRGIATWV